MRIQPDHFYVIRPGHVLTMKDGVFHLGAQLGKKSANRPVDDFFRSLAEEQRQRAICIVMSGMGSNGSAGAQAVKAVGGLVIAQDPETAQFPSMPRHLIDQGYADYILPPADMAEVLLQYVGHPYTKEDRKDTLDQLQRDGDQLRDILAILRTRTQAEFSGYRKATLLRRIRRRMGLTRITDMGDYARLLRQSPSELTALNDDLLIHVTGFFRDHDAWESMRKNVIAPLVARREPENEVRAWVTACSSGEEAYTLAMLLVEEAERVNKPLDIKVFATDMANRPLTHARAGVYPGGIETEIDPARLERFFEKDDGVYRVRQFLRECVLFAPQNVLSDPPFSRLDIVTCRNLLIYLEPDVQQRLLHLLHFGLREGGALFLGTSETAAAAEGMYQLIDKRARIYRRVGPTRHGSIEFPLAHALREPPAPAPGFLDSAGADAGPAAGRGRVLDAGGDAGVRRRQRTADRRLLGRPSIASITHRTLLEHYTPAAVTVDRDQRILYFHGNTRPFIDQPAGEPTRDLMHLLREGLRGSARVALSRAASEGRPVTVLDGWLDMGGGRHVRVAINAAPIVADDFGPDYFVVSFQEREELRSPAGPAPGGEVADDATRDELRRIGEELQSTIEELQTSNEELKAANEEVTSINEELQTSNEELETSKEEMQSLNEELITVNAQLQAKMEEHQNATNDLSALLHSTDVAVIFLDMRFRIRRFTPATRQLFDLIGADVGRPLKDMHSKFQDPDLESDARSVLEKLAPVEREVLGESGRTYLRRVLPYRTANNRIDGVVLTFFDVTRGKQAEREAAAAREYAEKIVETLHEPLLVLNPDLTVRSANPAFYSHFKVRPEQTIGQLIYNLGNGQWSIPALRTALEEVLPTNKVFENYEVSHAFEGLGRRVMLLNGRRLDHVQFILLGIRDITIERDVEQRLRRAMNIEGAGVLTFDVSSGTLLDANEAFFAMTGYKREQITSRQLTWRALTPPEHIKESEEQLARFHQTGRLGPYEKEYLRKDGSRVWMLFTGARLDQHTAIEYCIDVSDRKAAEATIRQTELQFRGLVDSIPAMVWSSDPAGNHEFFNRRCLDYVGRSQEDMTQRGWVHSIHPDDREQALRGWEQVMRDAKAYEMQFRIRRATDGEYRWHLVRGVPVRDGEGKITRWFGTASDIHDQLRAMEALKETETRFTSVVEDVQDYAIFMMDTDRRITSWNKGAEQVLGFCEEDVIGKSGDIIFTPEDCAERAPQTEQDTATREGRAADERWHVKKDGTTFWASGVLSALRTPQGTLGGYVKVLRDETSRKLAETVLSEAKQAAETASRMREDFLDVLSHELRTPLAVMMLWTKMLRSATVTPEAMKEGLDILDRSVETQKQLVEDLLDASRMSRGQLRIERREVELSRVIESAVESIRPGAEAKNLNLQLHLDPNVGRVRADPDRIQQVVWNLISNAVKFTNEGGSVTITLRRLDGQVEMRIADTGEGIDPTFLPHVFDRFSQADAYLTRRAGGVGLGLAISKHLVELHGGTIRALSEGLGKGATFIVRLPLPKLPTQPLITPRGAAKAGAAKSAVPRPAPFTGLRVLIVEDDQRTRDAIERVLKSEGAAVSAVSDGASALRVFAQWRPDAIISDIGLPDMDGRELMRQLRKLESAGAAATEDDEERQAVPAIAITAYSRPEEAEKSKAAGFQHHLSKPVEPQQIVATVKKALVGL
jgi:PAS domain S-box-containing protein